MKGNISSTAALRTFCLLRAESVRRQLAGKLSSVTAEQAHDDQVDASMLVMSDLR